MLVPFRRNDIACRYRDPVERNAEIGTAENVRNSSPHSGLIEGDRNVIPLGKPLGQGLHAIRDERVGFSKNSLKVSDVESSLLVPPDYLNDYDRSGVMRLSQIHSDDESRTSVHCAPCSKSGRTSSVTAADTNS